MRYEIEQKDFCDYNVIRIYDEQNDLICSFPDSDWGRHAVYLEYGIYIGLGD